MRFIPARRVYHPFIPFCCSEVLHCRAVQNLLIHSPVDGHVGCFQFGAIRNKVAINKSLYVYKSLYGYVLSLLLYKYPGVESLGHMVNVYLTFLKNGQTVFKSVCTTSHPHQPCMRVSVAPHLRPTPVFEMINLLNLVILISVWLS